VRNIKYRKEERKKMKRKEKENETILITMVNTNFLTKVKL